ncbi:MAG TPA: hypothetical protein VHE33_16180 [Acidobacteriaceae bacterium]|nr:hypothetical protein [Acidobacteriaceae bacterium]
MVLSPWFLLQPAVDDRPQRVPPEVVELVAALARRRDQACLFEHFQMLRDGLARRCDAMLHRQARAQLEQRLPVALRQLVQNRPPCRRCHCLKNVDHSITIGKSQLACQDVCLATLWLTEGVH